MSSRSMKLSYDFRSTTINNGDEKIHFVYWLDTNGNSGLEGNPMLHENLYLAAQRNNYTGAGSGGDNFWTTRFRAGYSNAQNTQGYVSVPGHGPVGYGLIGYSSGIILKGISITDSKFSPASRMSSSSAS